MRDGSLPAKTALSIWPLDGSNVTTLFPRAPAEPGVANNSFEVPGNAVIAFTGRSMRCTPGPTPCKFEGYFGHGCRLASGTKKICPPVENAIVPAPARTAAVSGTVGEIGALGRVPSGRIVAKSNRLTPEYST